MYDLVVIGTGPGGYHAAIRAAQLGMKVMAVEKKDVGGVCVNRGCIPTKFLLHSTKFIEETKKMAKNGIKVEKLNIDMELLQRSKERVVNKLVKGIEFLFRKNGVELKRGEAFIEDKGRVKIGDEIYETKNIVIASGSVPQEIPGIVRDGEQIIYGEEALFLTEIPEEVCIIGAGPTGLEIGFILSGLGSKVHIVEMMKQIVPGIDTEIANSLKNSLEKRGIKIYTSTKVERVNKAGNKIEVNIGEKILIVDKLLISAGRKPVTKYFKGIKKDEKGYIKVDKKLETSVEGIYAIGDVVGPPLLAHKAMKQGVYVAEIIKGLIDEYPQYPIPYVVYTEPAVFTIGKKAEEVKNPKTGKFPYSASGMASVMGRIEGFSKVVIDENDRIAGFHIIGEDAYHIGGETIAMVSTNMDAKIFTHLIHPHPTLTEIILETVENAFKKAIHIVN